MQFQNDAIPPPPTTLEYLSLFGEEEVEKETELEKNFSFDSAHSTRVPGMFKFKINQEIRLEILENVVLKDNWFNLQEKVASKIMNQKMVFGRQGLEAAFINYNVKNGCGGAATSLFSHLHECASAIDPLVALDLPEAENQSLGPLGLFEFDQMIANYYSKGDSVSDHVDLLRFHDGILIVNLMGTACLSFTHLHFASNLQDGVDQEKDLWKRDVDMEEGDCLFLRGPARYDWSHGIKMITCDERISVTFRRLVRDCD